MALFLSEIDLNIKKTLNRRVEQLDSNRTGWINRKTPWIRATSMAEINGFGDFRKKWILFGGLAQKNLSSGYKQMYNIPENMFQATRKETSYINTFTKTLDQVGFGSFVETFAPSAATETKKVTEKLGKSTTIANRPIPGITSVEVKNKGSMGAVREATISFVCWDLAQLSILEQLYMTPGISIILEWGWSLDMNGDPIYENLSSYVENDTNITKKIVQKVKQTGGHYDGMQGPITDFNWSLRDDGGFDCSTTIVSMADTFLAIDVHSKSRNFSTKPTDDKEDDRKHLQENFLAVYEAVYHELDKKNILKLEGDVVAQRIVYDKDRETRRANRNRQQVRDDNVARAVIASKNEVFVTWDFIEQELINKNLSYFTDNDVELRPRVNSKDVWINYRDNLMSADPYVCLFPDARLNFLFEPTKRKRRVAKLIEGVSAGFGRPIGISDTYISGLRDYSQLYDDIDISLKQDFFKPDEDKIRLSRLLVNLNFVYETHNATSTLHDFLMKLLTGISEACGNMWTFKLMIDEDNPEEIYVADVKTVESRDKIKPYIFSVYNRNSIVKAVTLNTEVDQKLKTHIMYGVNKSIAEQKDIGRESTLGFRFYGRDIKNLVYKNARTNSNKIEYGSVEQMPEEDINKNLDIALNRLVNKRNKDTSHRAKVALNKYILDVDEDSKGQMPLDMGFVALPVKLELTIDGIGGIKFGNAIDVDYKPDRYKGYSSFQITNVSQTINKDTWDTTLETVMRVDTAKLYGFNV